MTENRVETTKGLCVIALTKYLMDKFQITMDAAYERLMGMELYSLLMDTETGLYLETNDYLSRCCEIELRDGKTALYSFINNEEIN